MELRENHPNNHPNPSNEANGRALVIAEAREQPSTVCRSRMGNLTKSFHQDNGEGFMSTISGSYAEEAPDTGEFKLDVDGDYPLKFASGVVTSGIHSRCDWSAPLQPTGSPDSWTGVICFRDGEAALVPQGNIAIKLDRTQNPVKAVVTFSGSGLFTERRTYFRRSESFRSLEVEFDVVSGTSRTLDFNTASHPAKPSALPLGMLKVETVLQRAGFDVSQSGGNSTVPLPAGSDERWSNTELHDAMSKNWSRQGTVDAPDPSKVPWAIWVLFARLHESGSELGGCMFDRIGARQRQGVAIFNDSSMYKAPAGDPNGAAWSERMRFFSVCHEIGHGLNLAHCWERPDNVDWKIEDAPEEIGFMNYPDKVDGGQQHFFENFEYRFSREELAFMRHAPESMVKTGGAAWFDNVAFRQTKVSRKPPFRLELRINRSRPEYEFLEPCMMEIKLTNVSRRTRRIPQFILRDPARMTIIIKKDRKPARQWLPFVRHCFIEKQIPLAPGKSLYESLFPSVGQNGWDLAEPGYYTVQVALHMPEMDVVSNPLRLRVKPPENFREEYLSQDFFSDDVGRVLTFDGTRVLDKASDVLRETSEQLRHRAVAYHALVALGRPQMQEGKVLAVATAKRRAARSRGKYSCVEIISGDPDAGRKELGKALMKNPVKAIETLGHIDYRDYCEQFSQTLQKNGDPKGADKVRKNLYTVLRERGVKKPILDTIMRK
jgi:hypothetical protein